MNKRPVDKEIILFYRSLIRQLNETLDKAKKTLDKDTEEQ